MLRSMIFGLAIGFASAANAQDCPSFFRFADFGLKSVDGTVFRGGPVFRAEGFDGSPLLRENTAQCIKVPILAKDGRGNDVPVVSWIDYDPEKADLALSALRVSGSDDAVAMASDNAADHLHLVAAPDALTARGADYLCVHHDNSGELSCQFASPYAGIAPLVVYCDQTRCDMPVLAMGEHIFASADWARDASDPSDVSRDAAQIKSKIMQIYGFLVPLSSGIE